MLAPESLSDELEGIARRAQANGRLPSLNACVFRRGEVIWERALGLADVGAGIDATPDTQYRVASITKTFIAASVLQLRDAGELDLDDPLSRHLPDAPHGWLTLRRLLSHMSGLQRELPGTMWETLEFPATEQLLERAADADAVLSPGERWHYSNLAYTLLGHVISARCGMGAQEYVDRRLLGPLGVARTTWSVQAPSARPYFVEPFSDTVLDEPSIDLAGTAAAGGLWSTTADLARWGGFLADPDPAVLDPATVEQMHVVQGLAEADWSLGWGLGICLFRRGDRILAGHTGGLPGFVSIFLYDRAERTGAVALTNSSVWPKLTETGLDLAFAALDHFAARPETWRPSDAPPPEIESLLGRWWSEAREWTFSFRDGRLEARLESAPEGVVAGFESTGEDVFRTTSGLETGEELRVVRDEAGVPVTLYWATYPFRREPGVFGSAG